MRVSLSKSSHSLGPQLKLQYIRVGASRLVARQLRSAIWQTIQHPTVRHLASAAETTTTKAGVRGAVGTQDSEVVGVVHSNTVLEMIREEIWDAMSISMLHRHEVDDHH